MLLFKQVSKELLKNRVFTFLLWILSTLTSLLFFFIHFSIDGNKSILLQMPVRTENQELYLNALKANTILAANMLLVLISLSAFVFAMFFYRFLKASAKQIGCLKSLGFKSSAFYACFAGFSAVISLLGGGVGFALGFVCSDVLLNANMRSYSVTGLVKSVNVTSIILGAFVPMMVFCLVSVCSYALIRKKEAHILLAGVSKQGLTVFIRIANAFVQLLPTKNKFPLRIALRKPIAVFLIFAAVMGFTVLFVMGYSLTLSSNKVYTSQIKGHFYKYETVLESYQNADEQSNSAIYYLHTNGTIQKEETEIAQTIVGLESNEAVFAMENAKGQILTTPSYGTVYGSPALKEMYGIDIGDLVTVMINNTPYSLTVSDIAINAKANTIYIAKGDLAERMQLPETAFTGLLSMEEALYEGGITTTDEQKLEALERNSVSGKNSALINQLIGCFSGCILLFLALLLNFQDNANDMLILHSIGYRPKAIRKLFIDIYLPIIWCAFILMLIPSIYTGFSVQRSLSLQMADYLPFQINAVAIVGIFLLLNVIYFIVQSLFGLVVKRMVKKETILNMSC